MSRFKRIKQVHKKSIIQKRDIIEGKKERDKMTYLFISIKITMEALERKLKKKGEWNDGKKQKEIEILNCA